MKTMEGTYLPNDLNTICDVCGNPRTGRKWAGKHNRCSQIRQQRKQEGAQ